VQVWQGVVRSGAGCFAIPQAELLDDPRRFFLFRPETLRWFPAGETGDDGNALPDRRGSTYERRAVTAGERQAPRCRFDTGAAE